MFPVPEQFSAATKAQFEAQLKIMNALTSQAFDSAERVIALNINVTKAALEKSSAAAHQLFAAQDAGKLPGAVQPDLASMMAYGRQLLGIAATPVAATPAAAKPLALDAAKPVEAVKPVAVAKPVEAVKPAVAVAPPVAVAKPVAVVKPVEAVKPVVAVAKPVAVKPAPAPAPVAKPVAAAPAAPTPAAYLAAPTT